MSRWVRAVGAAALLLCSGLSGPANGQTLPPPPVEVKRVRLLDLSADVLAPGEDMFGLFWGSYARGIVPRLQLSAHFAAYLFSLLNLSAKVQLVDSPDLQLSLSGGGYWLALARFFGSNMVVVPLELRSNVPLNDRYEFGLAATYRWFIFASPDSSVNSRGLTAEAVLTRYDRAGAFYLKGRVPLTTTQQAHLSSVLGRNSVTGSLTLDDVASWSLVLGRDHLLNDTAHFRVGLGYRRHPGILLVDSLGHLVVELDVYWR